MAPTLLPGDRLLVDPEPLRRAPPRLGAIVVLIDPESPSRWLVKRVAAVEGPGARVTVLGDDPTASRDSRSFGPVARESLVGVAWFRYLPGSRRGPLAEDGPPGVPKS